jgi:hypothetical protein
MRFDSDGNIWIRQSWLDTAMRCAERARFEIVKPEWDIGGDAAHCGTAAHSAVETHLSALIADGVGAHFSRDHMREVIHQSIQRKIAEEGIKWNKYDTVAQLVDNAERCYEAWVREILPVMQERGLITPGALCEYKFSVVLFTLADGRTVGIEGTIDFVPETNEMWDWKNPGQSYREREKQKYAIQPTIYTLAAVLGGIPNGVEYSYPMDFTYGLAIRGVRKAKAQLLTVTRTQAHADFAIERLKSYVDLALNFTLQRPWPRNDDHFLCSSTWCPWWVLCKGAHAIDDSIPVQLKTAA